MRMKTMTLVLLGLAAFLAFGANPLIANEGQGSTKEKIADCVKKFLKTIEPRQGHG
jgi:hypothetical protein